MKVKKNKIPLPSISDPSSKVLSYLQTMGVDIGNDIIYTEDYSGGSPSTYLKHYFLGVGGPFADFLAWANAGVGWETEAVDFPTKEAGEQAKMEWQNFTDDIDLIGTMLIAAAYYYVLGKMVIVYTLNLAGDDFFKDKQRGITGIDPIDPLTLDEDSINAALKDSTGRTPFKQRRDDTDSPVPELDRNNQTSPDEEEDVIHLERNRVIFRTRNPFSRISPTGFSLFQNCEKDLETAAKFPRYRNQLSSKYANLHRHYIVNTEMLKMLEGGLDILQTKEQQEEYLYSIWEMLKNQMERGASIVTFDFITSQDISFGGSEPDINSIENATYDSIAFKTGVPLPLILGDAASLVNRSTLDTIGQFFIDKQKNGPQRLFADVVQEIADVWLGMNGLTGRFRITIKPFLNESKDAMYQRAVWLESANIPRTLEERREAVNLSPEITGEPYYGPNHRILSKGKPPMKKQGGTDMIKHTSQFTSE